MAQLCLTLCNPMDCGPPGSSVQGLSRQEYWRGLSFPSSGDLPDPRIKPKSLVSCIGRLLLSHQGSPDLQQTKENASVHTHTHTHTHSLFHIPSRYGLSHVTEHCSPRCRVGPCCSSLLSMGCGMPSARRDGRPLLQTAPLVPTGGTRAEELDEVGKMRAHVTEVPTAPWVTRAQNPRGLPISGGFPGVGAAWDTYPEKQRWGERD